MFPIFRLLQWLMGLVGLTMAQSAMALPPPPTAFFMDVCWMGFACMSNLQVTASFINSAFYAVSFVAVAIFLVGTALWVFSAGNDTLVQKGKGMMQYSLIGLALVVGSYALWRTVVFILYAGP